MKDYHGHKTMSDGSHVALSADEAKALWERIENEKNERASKLPDSLACLSAISQAKNRMRELGWREGVYCPRNGETFAVSQIGSTGMWSGHWSPGIDQLSHGFVIAADSAMNPQTTFFKPLEELTDDERERMKACDADNAAWVERLAKSLGAEE